MYQTRCIITVSLLCSVISVYKDFEIDLDGAQTLHILCYKKEGETAELIGKGALEVNYCPLLVGPTLCIAI